MENTKTVIRALLTKSVLIKIETQKDLLEKMENFDAAGLQRLQKILVEADKKQDQFLLQAIKNNPALLKKVKGVIRTELKTVRQEKENMSRKEELSVLSDLENALENL